MEPKKNPEISLEKKKGLFFQIGLVVTLVIVLGAFEWKSYEKVDYNLGNNFDAQQILITRNITIRQKMII